MIWRIFKLSFIGVKLKSALNVPSNHPSRSMLLEKQKEQQDELAPQESEQWMNSDVGGQLIWLNLA